MQDYNVLIDIYPIIFVIIGALIYYFGRLIGDTRVEEYDKAGYYINGMFFAIKYLLLPIIFVLVIYKLYDLYINITTIFIEIESIVLVTVQYFVLACISTNVKSRFHLYKFGLIDEAKNQFSKKIEPYESILNKDLIRFIEKNIFHLIPHVYGNKYTLFIFSIITLTISYHLVQTSSLIVFSISILLSFLIFTMMAISFGYNNSYYPPSRIQMKDGSVFEGKILKFGKYIYLLRDNKKIFINRDNINFVEENLFKEK